MNRLDEIIEKIAALQSVGEPPFDTGLFAAWRSNPVLGYRRADTTVFFTASIVFTLQRLKPKLSPKSQLVVENIAAKAQASYGAFQNKDGLKTYNFWKTKPSQHFPNGYVFGHFEHFRIPDDVDDTAMIYLSSRPTWTENQWLKHKLTLHANGSKHQIKNTYADYKNLRAYSTWFGKNMYIEFDACVLSNVLCWVFENQLPINQHDTDSLSYIRSVIATDRYLTEPFRCAHQYPRTVAIVYHVARLMGAFQVAALEPIRQKLIEDTQRLLQQPQPPLDVLVLQISLMRLGIKTPHLPAAEPLSSGDFETFYFFIAGLLTAYENPILYKLARLPLWHIRWQCEAHCWMLLAEYEALRVN
ncbi:MAG: hypothetical protein EAZ14_08140 [Runella slithyformis]|nr:MAG: hypothetical protein EAZ14_08140 [Runella slithyformis]